MDTTSKESVARDMPQEGTPSSKSSFFARASNAIASGTGKPVTFMAAVAIVIIWAVTGPLFGYSDTWQLVINTGTTIVTFLMVFLIQNTQNRDSYALQLKLDELIRANKNAHTVLLDIEKLSAEELCRIRGKYEQIAAEARQRLREGGTDKDIPEVNLD